MSNQIVVVSACKISPYAIPGIITPLRVVEQAACQAWNIDYADLYKKVRARDIVEARMVIFKYQHEQLNVPMTHIGRKTGFDHATVFHARKKVDDLLEFDKPFQKKYNKFLETIQNQTS